MTRRPGRPPKTDQSKTSNLTVRIPPEVKKLIVEMADGYDMSLTEYITTLVKRDAAQTPEG